MIYNDTVQYQLLESNGRRGRNSMEHPEAKVKSLAKAMNILACFTVKEPVWGVTELAARMELNKSNVHNILSTFKSLGYLEQLPDGRYRLGMKVLEYAFAINQNLGYPRAVFDILVDTADRTGEVVYFGVPYGANVLYLYVAHPKSRMGVIPYRDILGETAPLYCTGIGKAMLAHFPEEEWGDHLSPVRPKFQDNTITDRDALFEELRRTRRRGFAIDNVEREPNIRCVGMPIRDKSGRVLAGISVSGPSESMTDTKLLDCFSVLQSAVYLIQERIEA